jgi:hypothetical protein
MANSSASKVVVFKMPVARLLKLTRRAGRYEIVDDESYIDDIMASFNRKGDGGMTEIEQLFVGEIEHVHAAGFESVRRFAQAA